MAHQTYHRILIGAGSYSDALPAFRLVERLSEGTASEFGGIFVEETIVAELATLPGRQMITFTGELVMAPTPQQVMQRLKTDARAFRNRLAALARSRTCVFEQRRGDLIGLLCAMAPSWDVLILGHRATHRLSGPVVLIAPPGAEAQDAARLAEALARRLSTDTVALSLDPAASEVERVADEATLLSRIGRMAAATVVLDLAAGPLHSPGQLRDLLAMARCPVVVLGAGQEQSPP